MPKDGTSPSAPPVPVANAKSQSKPVKKAGEESDTAKAPVEENGTSAGNAATEFRNNEAMGKAIKRIREQRAELEETQSENKRLGAKLAESQSEAESERRRSAELQSRAERLQAELDDAKRQVTDAQAAAKEEAGRIRRELESAQASARAARTTATDEVAAVKVQLAAAKAELSKALKENASLTSKLDLECAGKAKLQVERDEVSKEKDELQTKCASAAVDLICARKETEELRSELQKTRNGAGLLVNGRGVTGIRALLESQLAAAWERAWGEVQQAQQPGNDAAHRTLHPGQPVLRKRSSAHQGAYTSGRNCGSGTGVTARNTKRIEFLADSELVSTVNITGHRHQKEDLWFPAPESNVICDVCMVRVPQKHGRLRGDVGRSQLSLDEFLCGACAAANPWVSNTTASVAHQLHESALSSPSPEDKEEGDQESAESGQNSGCEASSASRSSSPRARVRRRKRSEERRRHGRGQLADEKALSRSRKKSKKAARDR